VNEGTFTAQMTWMPAPAGYPSPSDYLVGDVKNAANTIVGRLTMGWVSKFLRKATVEVDRVSVSEAPLGNGAGVAWQSVFNSAEMKKAQKMVEAAGADSAPGKAIAKALDRKTRKGSAATPTR
jgi:hypothetical protein